ncbi:MAG: hypothetical protein NVS4B12_21590 [Ktedonobacteraceae bacterium]
MQCVSQYRQWRFLILGMVVLIILVGCSGPLPQQAVKPTPTPIPTVNFAPICPIPSGNDRNAVMFLWTGSISYRTDIPGRNLNVSYSAKGQEHPVEGNHLKVYYRVQTIDPADYIACLVLFAQWQPMTQPKVINYKDYSHFVEKSLPIVTDFIDISLDILPLYKQNSGTEIANPPLPSRIPIHLSAVVITRNSKVYHTADNELYTFTRE